MRERITRLSRSHSPYVVQQTDEFSAIEGDVVGLQITPIYRTGFHGQNVLPGMSFSAQLLELGLKHNVEGLVQKAHEQLSYDSTSVLSAQHKATQHYEQAQDNFSRDSLHMVERSY